MNIVYINISNTSLTQPRENAYLYNLLQPSNCFFLS